MARFRGISTARAAGLAAGAGVLAGLVLAVAEVVGATVAGRSPLLPLRMAASVLLGDSALDLVAPAPVVGVAILDHLVVSAILGVAYLVFAGQWAERWRGHPRSQALLGILFGTAVWLFNFQLVGRFATRWFLDTMQAPQWVAHAFFFGLPLAAFFRLLMPHRLAVASAIHWPAEASEA
jgi:hypothetical protein